MMFNTSGGGGGGGGGGGLSKILSIQIIEQVWLDSIFLVKVNSALP